MESGERLPGRKGNGKVIFFRPWSFREFMDMFYSYEVLEYKKINCKNINQNWLESQKIKWQEYFDKYIYMGGFPQVVGECINNHKISDLVCRVYEDWILGTWSKLRIPEKSLRQVSKKICENINSRTSYDAIKKGSDIQSANNTFH